jgi:hypothetical protein
VLRGLAIINHQRHLPALDRDHEHVFQADVISTADHQGFSLLTDVGSVPSGTGRHHARLAP